MHIFRAIIRLVLGGILFFSSIFSFIDQINSLNLELSFLYNSGSLTGATLPIVYGSYQLYMAFQDFRQIHHVNKTFFWIASFTPLGLFIYSLSFFSSTPKTNSEFLIIPLVVILTSGHLFDFFFYKKEKIKIQQIEDILDL